MDAIEQLGRTGRSDEITAIVNETMDAMFAEQDRHGAKAGSYADCMCGWTAPERSRKPRVSLGLHVKAAWNRAQVAQRVESDRRIAETRRSAR